VGIEAISRGAALAVFVENHSAAVRLIRENLSSLEITSEARVSASSVSTAIAKLQQETAAAFEFIFLDPPYANEMDYESTLDSLENSSLADESTIVMAEHHKKSRMPKSVGRLQQFRVLVQGDAALTFYRKASRQL
jgi:16S rRNA (guanine966-N2)-methyltransferase